MIDKDKDRSPPNSTVHDEIEICAIPSQTLSWRHPGHMWICFRTSNWEEENAGLIPYFGYYPEYWASGSADKISLEQLSNRGIFRDFYTRTGRRSQAKGVIWNDQLAELYAEEYTDLCVKPRCWRINEEQKNHFYNLCGIPLMKQREQKIAPGPKRFYSLVREDQESDNCCSWVIDLVNEVMSSNFLSLPPGKSKKRLNDVIEEIFENT